jgi:hypothetical protein
MDDSSINEFLERIKADGRSSPAEMHWGEFHEMLCRHGERVGAKRPLMPLILAASGESSSTKHYRLREQLRWAQDKGCLVEALHFLNDVPPEKWNRDTAENWNRSSYGE